MIVRGPQAKDKETLTADNPKLLAPNQTFPGLQPQYCVSGLINLRRRSQPRIAVLGHQVSRSLKPPNDQAQLTLHVVGWSAWLDRALNSTPRESSMRDSYKPKRPLQQ
jgi:hypothetical protein